MKKKKIIALFIGIIIIGICVFVVLLLKRNSSINNENDLKYLDLEVDHNQVAYNENSTIDEIKQDAGISGSDDIYELQTEYDGRKTLVVKSGIKFKVAFAGMIKNELPQMEELDSIFDEYIPQKNGIWININSRDKVLVYLNNSSLFNSRYSINDEGYLTVDAKNNQTELDKKIENVINSNQINILTVSSVCYTIDNITGQIIDNDFEFIDKYQTYDYYEDGNKKIIFISENKESQLSNDEIIESIIMLF